MAKAQIVIGANGGGGELYYVAQFSIAGGAPLDTSSLGITINGTPKEVYIFESSRGYCYTNVNPSTHAIETSKMWRSTSGWGAIDMEMSGNSVICTNGRIQTSAQLSSNTQNYIIFYTV